MTPIPLAILIKAARFLTKIYKGSSPYANFITVNFITAIF